MGNQAGKGEGESIASLFQKCQPVSGNEGQMFITLCQSYVDLPWKAHAPCPLIPMGVLCIMQGRIENHIISSPAFATGNFTNALKFKEAAEVAI